MNTVQPYTVAIKDEAIHKLLWTRYRGFLLFLVMQCDYEIQDIAQECHYYFLRHPSAVDFMGSALQEALCDIYRREVGRNRKNKKQENKRQVKTRAIHHHFDNPFDTVARNLPFFDKQATFDLRDALIAAMKARLSHKEQWIVMQYYWLEKSLKELGQLMDPKVTESRMSQIMTRALAKLSTHEPLQAYTHN